MPAWEWATPFGYTYPGAATMDANGNNFYIVGYEDSATACGQDLVSDGLGFYVTGTDWQNVCQWALPVPLHLGSLYIDDLGQLRFQGWFEQPLEMADTVFDPGEGTMIVNGAIDPDLGLIDGHIIARARYELVGPVAPRMLRDNGHILLAVNFTDSVRFDDSLFVSEAARSVLAEFDPSGALLHVRDLGTGEMELGGLAEDSGERVFIAGVCYDCAVRDTTIIVFGIWPSVFVACMDTAGGTEWIWQRGGAFESSADMLVTTDDRVVVGCTEANGNGLDPFSYVEILNGDGESDVWFEVADGNLHVHTPRVELDAEQNIIAWGWCVGSNPDQRIVCADPDGDVQWAVDLNQGGNLWSITVYPVDTGTYLVTGQFEISISLGPHFLQWQPAGFTNGFIAKLGDFTVGADAPVTLDHGMVVHPNPVRSTLYVHPSGPTQDILRILDVHGREVKRFVNSAPVSVVDVSELDQGIYLLAGSGGCARFVKE